MSFTLPIGLRARLMVPIVAAVIPAVVLLGYLAIRERERTEQRAETEALQIVGTAAVQHQHVLESTRTLLLGLARFPAIRASDPAAASLLAGVLGDDPDLDWIALADARGRVIASAGPAPAGPELAADSAWMRIAAAREFVVGGFDARDTRLVPRLVVGLPIVEERGERLLAGVTLGWVGRVAEQTVRFPGARFALIGEDGEPRAVIPPTAGAAGRAFSEPELRAALRTRERGTIRLVCPDGVPRVHAFTALPGGNGARPALAFAVDARAMFEPARRTFIRSLVVLLGSTLLLLGFVWQGLRALVLRRLEALVATARKLRDGDFDARTGLPHEPDEIAHLASALDNTAEGLRTRELERERAETRVVDSEARKTAILEVALDAIVTLDRDGRVVEYNPAAEHMFGFRRGQTIGRSLVELIVPPALREAHLGGIRRFLETGYAPMLGQRLESDALRADGSMIPVEITITPLRTMSGDVFFTAYVRDITERKRYEEALRTLSLVDELTGLYNRRGFLAVGAQHLRMADRVRRPIYIAYADVDGLKHINDVHGHSEGDRALVETARLLRRTFRRSDVVGRIGGDEFAVLALEASGPGMERLEQRLRERLAALNEHSTRRWRLELSLGRVQYQPAEQKTLESLLEAADAAMYEEKRVKREGAGAN